MSKLLALPFMNSGFNKPQPKEIIFKIMCNEGHTTGAQQGEKEDKESLCVGWFWKCFQGIVSFVLKVCEEELTKWTTGEAGQSILV